ncbi:hypothetical protein KAT36_00460 [Candidatus Pacearchaeota archaeon]|nr:hypothetical protein [Candidatus Pacearchaeota archaeon]
MKYLIFDAGPIISLTMNGMLPVLERLKEVFDGEFILTPAVKREVVDRPMRIKKFKLEAMQIQGLIRRGLFKMSGDIVSNQKLDKEVKRILKIANGVLRTTDMKEKIKIIHGGEAACLAFANLCGCENVIVIDERTTRMLTEAPEKLEKMMERKLHTPLDAELSLLDSLKKFKFIRSAELLYVAHRKGLIGIKGGKDLLDALLYGVKFKGCAISSVEIEEMKLLV